MALLEDNLLVELYVEKEKKTNYVGNIYKGIVRNVLPGMGAAFVDIGEDRTAFLHYTDLSSETFEEEELDESDIENKFLPQDAHKIGDYLKIGQEIVAQVQKGPVGTKGARLIGQISIPGKLLVFFPYQDKIAISRRIYSYQEKNRIKSILQSVKEPSTGMIVRTEAENCTAEELTEEYKMLYKTWKFLEKKINESETPSCIFDENDIVSTLVRDLFTSKIHRLVVDDKDFFEQITQRLKEYNEELSDRCELYKEDTPIFDAYNIEKEIEKIFRSRIYLPSGGNLVIETTEALVAIDVNTGSFTGKQNYEETLKKTNLEAAKEIVRQIRLRNLSGIVVIDFIDMNDSKSRQQIFEQMIQGMKKDRAKSKVFPFTAMGLVEVTRKRTRTSILHTYFEHCPYCHGTGKILARDSVLFKINRWLQRAEYFIQNKNLNIYVHPLVKKTYEKNPSILTQTSNKITILEDGTLDQDIYRVMLKDEKKVITSKYNP
ncbi:MAG: Rne/Rng family ribonuclease [Candidatus Cloacimonetes bacterium]|nr:Rne/Rng family ribonuclease [Candidatus Cloacimonadota bacterium]